MSAFPYQLEGPIGAHALGLIVLQVDETVEQDFRRLFASPEIAVYVSRVSSGDELNPDTIASMETHLPAAAALLPPATRFDAVGYACTSGTALIGADVVAGLVGGRVTTRAVTDPLTAAIAAFRVLSVKRIGIVSPYIPSVATPICQGFERAGIGVAEALSFGEDVEARVARIAAQSIREAALRVGRGAGVEGVFLSCTNLRTLDIIDDIERTLGIPVVSSNQALAWHMARLAGTALMAGLPGRLGDIG